MRRSERLAAALTAISAAVVGVVLNLAVWFAGGVLMPAPGQVDVFAVVVSVASLAILSTTRLGVMSVIAMAAATGLAFRLIIGSGSVNAAS
jgi:chromate transporter